MRVAIDQVVSVLSVADALTLGIVFKWGDPGIGAALALEEVE
jgi:hypothetical protein